jgi:hypothetical protein
MTNPKHGLGVSLARGAELDPDLQREVESWHERRQGPTYEVIPGVDRKNLAEAGWGVIFAHEPDTALRDTLRDALGELLALRKSQASDLYKEFIRERAY